MIKSRILSASDLSLLIVTPLLLSTSAQAISLVETRTHLGAEDQVDWSSLGSVFNPFELPDPNDFLPSSFPATSEQGLGIEVNIPLPSAGITPPFVFINTLPPNGVPANFADGDFVLFTGLTPGQFPSPGNPGPLSITFEQPILATGAQLSVDDTPTFNASLSAFDDNDILLGTFTLPGTGSTNIDNSAVFLGVSSDIPNIKRIEFFSSEDERAIGINSLSIKTMTVPEPSLILAWGFFGLALMMRKSS